MTCLGYIVYDQYAIGSQQLVTRSTAFLPRVPPGGILRTSDRVATVFPSRGQARAACRRTVAWEAAERWPSRGHGQPDQYLIVRLEAAP